MSFVSQAEKGAPPSSAFLSYAGPSPDWLMPKLGKAICFTKPTDLNANCIQDILTEIIV